MDDIYLPRCPWHSPELDTQREAILEELQTYREGRRKAGKEGRLTGEQQIRQALAGWYERHRQSCQKYMALMRDSGQDDGYHEAKSARDDVDHKANSRRLSALAELLRLSA